MLGLPTLANASFMYSLFTSCSGYWLQIERNTNRQENLPSFEGKRETSKIVHQFFNGDIGLLQNGLQRFRFNLPVHWHARMQAVFLKMTMRTRLADKLKTQSFQGATHIVAGKVAGEFHAT